MATSNSYNYSIDRDTLIRSAFELVGVAIQGEDLNSDDITVAARALNLMIKAWVVHGLQVWKRRTYTIDPLVLNKQWYELGTNVLRPVTLTGSGTTATATLTNHGFSTGDTVTITGATDTDFNVTDGSITVTDKDTFTYTGAGTLDASDSGSCQKTGTDTIVRPERILDASRVNSDGDETSMTELTRDEYENLPNKTTAGEPINFHYERKTGAGRFYIWPVADSTSVSDYTIDLVYQIPIEDMDSATDDFDFPPEWLEPLAYGLAVRLAPRYGLNIGERRMLQIEADIALETVKDYDVEDGSIYFQPDGR